MKKSRHPEAKGQMVRKRACERHGKDQPCTCAMGNIYRFVEPVVLLMLKQKGQSYGYDLVNSLKEHALTDAEIEGAALYRTLRRLEKHRYVKSEWDVRSSGPARRLYSLTQSGEDHLHEWAVVLSHLSKSMNDFVHKTNGLLRLKAKATGRRT